MHSSNAFGDGGNTMFNQLLAECQNHQSLTQLVTGCAVLPQCFYELNN